MTTKRHIQRAILGILFIPFILIGIAAAFIIISLRAGYAHGDKILTKIVTDEDTPI